MGKFALSRKGFLKGTAVAAGAATFGVPAFIPRIGEAADQIKIGAIDPQTGTYAALGKSEFSGMQMAMEAWNKKGGAMGREVVLVKEDSAADPGVAVQKARKLVNQDKCVALIGSVSSAVSLSVGGAANSMGVLFMDTGGHSDTITMKECHWSTFQICHPTWMLTHATGYTFSKFGKKWYAITPGLRIRSLDHGRLRGHREASRRDADRQRLRATRYERLGAYLPKLAVFRSRCLHLQSRRKRFRHTDEASRRLRDLQENESRRPARGAREFLGFSSGRACRLLGRRVVLQSRLSAWK